MRLSFYNADPAYCNFLSKYDSRVPYTFDKKYRRPFVGIVIETANGIKYYAPLTSPKPKHLTMNNTIDFHKINNGIWGAINFNNMIPINEQSLSKVNLKIEPNDTKDDIDYKNLLSNQLSWCNSNRDAIINKARKLYKIITEGKAPEKLSKRCCDFKLLETKCIEYMNIINVRQAQIDAAAALSEKIKSGNLTNEDINAFNNMQIDQLKESIEAIKNKQTYNQFKDHDLSR